MRLSTLRIVTAAGLAVASASAAAHHEAAAWHAGQQAEAAQQALSERYTAIWATLSAAEKTRFSAQQRAWLNEGRERERQACIDRTGVPTQLVIKRCEASVTERHLRGLEAPARVVALNASD
jgi:uncharacterized protein YecT (DUF1311 family)